MLGEGGLNEVAEGGGYAGDDVGVGGDVRVGRVGDGGGFDGGSGEAEAEGVEEAGVGGQEGGWVVVEFRAGVWVEEDGRGVEAVVDSVVGEACGKEGFGGWAGFTIEYHEGMGCYCVGEVCG